MLKKHLLVITGIGWDRFATAQTIADPTPLLKYLSEQDEGNGLAR